MKAIVQERFGPPDVLQLVDTDRPVSCADEGAGSGARRRAQPVRLAHHARRSSHRAAHGEMGLTKPKARVAGVDAAGRVEAVGNVRGLRHGAAVGVGTYALQIAAALGAEVTGVCSTRNAGLVRSVGAAHVVDYTTEDFTDGRAHFDVILDNVGNRPLRLAAPGIDPGGDPRAQRRRLTRPRAQARRWHPAGGRGQRSRPRAAQRSHAAGSRADCRAASCQTGPQATTPVRCLGKWRQ